MGKRRSAGEGGITKLKSGSFRVELSVGKDGDGKRVRDRQTFDTMKEAIAWRNKRLEELGRAGGAGPGRAGKMTVKEWLVRWKELSQGDLAPATVSRYQSAADDIIHGIGGKQLASLSRQDVREWMQAMKEATKEVGKGAKRKKVPMYPDGERRYALDVLRIALAEAVRQDLIPANPASRVKRPAPQAKRKQRPLTAQECRHAVAVAAEYGMAEWFAVGIDSGCRPSEMLGLQWAEVTLPAEGPAVIHVRQSLCTVSGSLKSTKTKAGDRKIPLGAQATEALRRLHAAARGVDGKEPKGHVFHDRGVPWDYASAFTSRFRRVALAAGFGRTLAPYDLRHTCATLLLSAGVSLRVVADRLGHKNPGITLKHYSHALAGQQEAAALTMSGLLEGPNPTPAPRTAPNS